MSAQFRQHARKQALLAEQQGGALRPSRRNVGQNQRLGEAAPRHWSAVRYQICFEVTGRRIVPVIERPVSIRSEEHTSELQSLMRISYAVFCLKKKKKHTRL